MMGMPGEQYLNAPERTPLSERVRAGCICSLKVERPCTWCVLADEVVALEQERYEWRGIALDLSRINVDLEEQVERLRDAVREYLPLVDAYRDAVTEHDCEQEGSDEWCRRMNDTIQAERQSAKRLRALTKP